MTDLALAVTISGTAGLALTEAAGYQVVSVGPGARSWRKETVTSPFVHGRAVVSQVLDAGSFPLLVRVKALTAATLASRITALLHAVEQVSYDTTVVIDGVTWTWRCETADTSIGEAGSLDPHGLRNLQQLVTCSIPRHPVPIAGPM